MKRPYGTHFNLIPSPSIPSSLARRVVRQNFDEMVNDLFANFFGDTQSIRDKVIAHGKLPRANVYVEEITSIDENGNNIEGKEQKVLTFECAVPGIKKEDIVLEADFEKGKISISYDNKEEAEQENRVYVIRELSKATFYRSWEIPTDKVIFGGEEDICISMENGILKISLQFVEQKEESPPHQTRRITIQ